MLFKILVSHKYKIFPVMKIKTKKLENKICIDVTEDDVDYRIIADSYYDSYGNNHIGADSIDTYGFLDPVLAKKQIIHDLERYHDIIVDSI